MPSEITDETLVAYLDGELPEELVAEVQQQIDSDPQIKERIRGLQATWDLLSELPEEQPDPKLAQSTIEIVALSLGDAPSTWKHWVTRHKWSILALSVVLCFAAGAVAARGVSRMLANGLLQDLHVLVYYKTLKQLDTELSEESLEWIERLAAMPGLLEAADGASMPMVGDGQVPQSVADRRAWVHELDTVNRRRLLDSYAEYLRLPEPTKDSLRAAAEKLTELPSRGELGAATAAADSSAEDTNAGSPSVLSASDDREVAQPLESAGGSVQVTIAGRQSAGSSRASPAEHSKSDSASRQDAKPLVAEGVSAGTTGGPRPAILKPDLKQPYLSAARAYTALLNKLNTSQAIKLREANIEERTKRLQQIVNRELALLYADRLSWEDVQAINSWAEQEQEILLQAFSLPAEPDVLIVQQIYSGGSSSTLRPSLIQPSDLERLQQSLSDKARQLLQNLPNQDERRDILGLWVATVILVGREQGQPNGFEDYRDLFERLPVEQQSLLEYLPEQEVRLRLQQQFSPTSNLNDLDD